MSADVGALGSGSAAVWTLRRRAPAPPALQPPEDQPFEVATINQRLASLAAARSDSARIIDIKA
jgi:hypothetical protein